MNFFNNPKNYMDFLNFMGSDSTGNSPEVIKFDQPLEDGMIPFNDTSVIHSCHEPLFACSETDCPLAVPEFAAPPHRKWSLR